MKKRNWYTILLLVSLLLAAGWKMDMRVQKWQHERNTVDEAENTVDEFSPQTTEENITSQEPAESEEEPQEEETEPDKPSFPEIDNSFDDADYRMKFIISHFSTQNSHISSVWL